MNKPVAFTTHLDGKTIALVEKLAIARGISSDRFAAEAIQRVAVSEAEWLEFLDAGIADLDAGRSVSHDVVVAKLQRMRDKYDAKCRQ